jgi:AraC family transcriptional regulator, transcriptional activator of the genes for pyochelin and ferripyochelin receptors
MTYKLAAHNIEEMIGAWGRIAGTPPQHDGYGTTIAWTDRIGRGTGRVIRLRPDLELFMYDATLATPITIDFRMPRPSLELSFCLQGYTRYQPRAHRSAYTFGAGQCGLFWQPDVFGHYEQPAGQRIVTLELQLAPPLLRTLLHDYAAPLPSAVAAIGYDSHGPVVQPATITPAMRVALDQMLQCSYTGSLQRLYLESKALELIALYLGEIQTSAAGASRLRADDVDRIEEARDVLIARMDDPPSLIELARLVHINDRKLKEGFRQVFGTTVFGYLHQRRMERARELLARRDHSVSEVAWMIGYRNPSKFAAAYKKQFGVSPKQSAVEPKPSGME